MAKKEQGVTATHSKPKVSIEELNKARKESGNLWWRPSKYTKSEELSEPIEKYFLSITRDIELWTYNKKEEFIPTLNNSWEPIIRTIYEEHPSILGMCEYLWIHRDTLLEYEKKEEFSATIKRAKQRIERYNADLLSREKNVTWIIFNLKNNFGWVDKQEIDQTSKNININKDVSELSDEELDKIISEV